jgi:hypothetical protein
MGSWQLAARRALGVAAPALGCAAVAIGVAPAVARPRPAAAKAKAVTSCAPKHAPVTAKTASVVVYAEDDGTDSDSGGTIITYYACQQPKGKPVAVGQAVGSGGEYPANVEMQDLRIAGTFVTEQSAAGFASLAACGKYEPSSACTGVLKYWVRIADVATRRTVKVFQAGPVSSLTLSTGGAAAWVVTTPASSSSGSASSTLYATVVHPAGHDALSAQPMVIDSGQAITAVSFAGSSLRWSNGGQPKRQTIP